MTAHGFTFLFVLGCAAISFSQTVSTDSAAASAAARDSSIVGDSTAAPPAVPEAAEQPEPALSDTGANELPFSLFFYPKIISIGVSLSWLYYSEDVDMGDLVGAFRDHYGNDPRIFGAPKSDEYGAVFGLSLGETFYHWENKAGGAAQGQPARGRQQHLRRVSLQEQDHLNATGDTMIGMEFDPYNFTKTNVFFHAGCDVGYAFPYFALPCFVYSGIDAKLWYRDLMDNQSQVIYNPDMSNWELYYWFSLPLGVNVAAHVWLAFRRGRGRMRQRHVLRRDAGRAQLGWVVGELSAGHARQPRIGKGGAVRGKEAGQQARAALRSLLSVLHLRPE